MLPGPGDMVALRADAFVGKRKMKDKWSNECYEVICQNGDVPTYDSKDKNGKVKTIHHNCLLFLFSHQGILKFRVHKPQKSLENPIG